jgi:hypothetical protein
LHVPLGSTLPAGVGVHLPSVDASVQLRQAPVQAVSQHTPSTQCPLMQSAFATHALPSLILPHDVLMQACPGSQSESTMQEILHSPPEHRFGLQLATPGGLQVPAPSQTAGRLRRTAPVHVGMTQTVSAGYRSQPPKPSHLPSLPQLAGPWSWQRPRGSGAVESTGQHVPTRLGSAHETQPPSQATLQHTESAQKPEAHSSPVAHFAPFIFLPQLLATHWRPSTHWLSWSQWSKQAPIVLSQP